MPGVKDDFSALAESYLISVENDWLEFDPFDSYVSKIPDAKYDKANIKDVAATQTHLTQDQRNDLEKPFKKMKNFLVENWDYTHTKKSILNYCQSLSLSTPDITLCQKYIWKPLKRN